MTTPTTPREPMYLRVDADLLERLRMVSRFYGDGSLQQYAVDKLREAVQIDEAHFAPAIEIVKEAERLRSGGSGPLAL